jgi:hypothetical protein
MRVVTVDETQAKQLLSDLLARFTAGSVLHLLAEVLKDQAGEQDGAAADAVRDAAGALFVLGIGLNAVWPGR